MVTTSTTSGTRPRRVLVTGSTTWANPAIVREALHSVWGEDVVLVTAERPCGAERIAEMFWRRWGGQIERHPSNWQLHAGKGADVCLAFIRDGEHGAANTVHLAESAGIPVYLHTNHTRSAGTSSPPKHANAREAAPAGRTAQPAAGAPDGARVWLDVPFREKNQAKKLGAAWDREARRWYAPAGMTEGLARWAPAPAEQSAAEPAAARDEPTGEPSSQDQPASSVTAGDVAGELGATVLEERALMSPVEVATNYSYPEIAALLANAPDGEAARVCREAMRLVIDQPDLYAGDQAGEIARQLSPGEIARHRDAIGHGPLFELLGQAAEHHAGQPENGVGRDPGESVTRANQAVAELAGAAEHARRNGDPDEARRQQTALWGGAGDGEQAGLDQQHGYADGGAR